MLFNSFEFLWIFPLIFFIYHWIPSKNRVLCNATLLIISYLLYMKWNPVYTLILIGVTGVTYSFALLIEKKQAYGQKKYIIASGTALALLPLLIFKYYNFLLDALSSILASIGFKVGLPGLNWAIPIGISFFTFQAVGYLLDVYRQKIKAEQNWWDYMLFISFFPQIMSGPISKASDLLPQIKAKRPFDYDKSVQGLKWLLWGMFLKVVMADRVGLYVNSVFDNYIYQSGFSCFIASLMYSMQIYGDFAGYSLMAIGVGRLMGFDLINNFQRPYFAASITEFWHRWHISLTKWLTANIYIAMGGSHCSKFRCYWNILITFLISGIWHGANWTFIVWGAIHGAIQIIEKHFGFQKVKHLEGTNINLKKHVTHSVYLVGRIIITFMIVSFAWIFFRMPTLKSALIVIKKIFFNFDGNLFLPSNSILGFMIISLVIVILKEISEEFFPQLQVFNNKHAIIRWISYLAVIILIILCGVFDSGQFIYISF